MNQDYKTSFLNTGMTTVEGVFNKRDNIINNLVLKR